MQATQSSTASGTTSRSEQFAALRFISHQMVEAADVELQYGASCGGPPGNLTGGGKAAADLAHDAESLLAVLGLYSELLARPDLSWDEHIEYAGQLKLLTDQSWELVGRFLRRSQGSANKGSERWADRERASLVASAVPDLTWAGAALSARRGPRSERGSGMGMQRAAGWMAC